MTLDFFAESGDVFTALGEESNYTITRVDRTGPAFDIRRELYNGWDTTILALSPGLPDLESAKTLAQAMEDCSEAAARKCKRRNALKKAKRVSVCP